MVGATMGVEARSPSRSLTLRQSQGDVAGAGARRYHSNSHGSFQRWSKALPQRRPALPDGNDTPQRSYLDILTNTGSERTLRRARAVHGADATTRTRLWEGG